MDVSGEVEAKLEEAMVPVVAELIEFIECLGRLGDLEPRKPTAQEGFVRSLGCARSRVFLKEGSGSRGTA